MLGQAAANYGNMLARRRLRIDRGPLLLAISLILLVLIPADGLEQAFQAEHVFDPPAALAEHDSVELLSRSGSVCLRRHPLHEWLLRAAAASGIRLGLIPPIHEAAATRLATAPDAPRPPPIVA